MTFLKYNLILADNSLGFKYFITYHHLITFNWREKPSTFACYTANGNDTVNAVTATGNLTITTSSIVASNYRVNFIATPTDSELELSQVVIEVGTDSSGTFVALGDLVYGVTKGVNR